jgi:sigma-B regulation protein RsbU (phosphoserine phosphatase)
MTASEHLESDVPAGRFGRPVLGLLVNSIDDSYQNELVVELAAAARKRDVNLLCFAGGRLRPTEQASRPLNRVYELASADNVDALVVSSGSLECEIGSERLGIYLERFRPLPVCSIGVALPDTPSIVVDNTAGTREAVLHLITHHGREHIAFIQGPEGNEEADQRFRGYQDALRDRSIELDERLVVRGDFVPESGTEAIRVLLDARGVRFDGVMAASDDMALGALAELESRGIRVPEWVAVMGFDDVVAGRYASRPLSTVRQRVASQAVEAVRVSLRQLRGDEIPHVIQLNTELVPRRSCGCPMQLDVLAVQPPTRAAQGTWQEQLESLRPQILIEMLTAAPELSGAKWADQLLDAYVAQLCGDSTATFAGVLDDLAEQTRAAGLELRLLQPVITSLRRGVAPVLLSVPEKLLEGETLLHEGRVLLANMIRHREVQQRLDAEQNARVLSSLARDLITTADLPSLLASVSGHLPALGIPSCFLSLHPAVLGEPAEDSDTTLRLLLAYDQRRPTLSASKYDLFPLAELVPRRLLPSDRAYAYVVQSLFFRERAMGVVLFELGPRDGAVYESLRSQISAALDRTLLAAERASRA